MEDMKNPHIDTIFRVVRIAGSREDFAVETEDHIEEGSSLMDYERLVPKAIIEFVIREAQCQEDTVLMEARLDDWLEGDEIVGWRVKCRMLSVAGRKGQLVDRLWDKVGMEVNISS
jgi:hypothetical protein